MGEFEYIRTDLALENSERFKKDNVEIKGVEIEKENLCQGKITVSNVIIKTNDAATVMKKPIGTYTTIESAYFALDDEEIHEIATDIIAVKIQEMAKINKKTSFLVVGLGNRDITADALGPKVADMIFIDEDRKPQVYVVSPGVMAQSGMESAVMIKGIVEQIKPDFVIAVDALAAGNAKRLNTVIQISDTGISPGSGVGNHRNGINQGTVGVPVIAIGAPMVVNVATIVNDVLDSLLDIINTLKTFSKEERFKLSEEIIEPIMCSMYVTTDHIDENVNRMAKTIATGINKLTVGV